MGMRSWALLVFLASFSLAHECQHDQIMEDHLARHGPIPEELHSRLDYGPAFDAMLASKGNVRGRKLLAPASIRFHIETFFASDEFTCYSAGERVWIGSGEPSGDFTPACQEPTDTSAGLGVECWLTCTDEHVYTAALGSYLDRLLSDATAYLSSALRVEPVVGPLTVETVPGNDRCGVKGGVAIPDMYINGTGPGVENTDMVLLVTARPTVGKLLAYAAACRSDATTKRPIMGHVNLAPNSIEILAAPSTYQRAVAIHELMHALGFSYANFVNFWDPVAMAPRSSTPYGTATIGTTDTYTTNTLVTPKVVEEARAHYACPTLDGMLLENQGSEGTRNSHWEKRVVHNELMSGSVVDNFSGPDYSRLTLALFEDSGWYEPDYSMASDFEWGKDQGCNFVTGKCSPSNWDGANYVCTAATQDNQFCNYNREARSYCNVATFTTTPGSEYSVLSDPNLFGREQLHDYCPIIIPYSNGFCRDTSNDDPDRFQWFESHDSFSACFESTVANLNEGPAERRGRCYRHGCTSDGDLKIQVAHKWYTCQSSTETYSNGEVFAGSLECPDSDFLARVCADVSGTWPTVTGVNPAEGPLSGGIAVTVTGTGFGSGMYLDVGGVKCSAVTVMGDTEAVCETAAFRSPTSGGTNDVTVIDSDGRLAALSGGFTFNEESGAGATVPPTVAVLVALLAFVAAF